MRSSRQALPWSLLGVLIATGCGGPANAPPFRPIADTQQLMIWILDPAADIVWGSVATILTLEGTEEIAPSTDEEWDLVRNAAAIVAESGNLLMMEPRAQDHEDWMQISQGLVDAGVLAMAATDARDTEALFDAGGRIYNVCVSCHQQYIPFDQEAPELPPQ